MVFRTLEVTEIGYPVKAPRRREVLERLRELYGHQLDISEEGEEVLVRGDLHNYRRRRRILWILSAGLHGEDLPRH